MTCTCDNLGFIDLCFIVFNCIKRSTHSTILSRLRLNDCLNFIILELNHKIQSKTSILNSV